MPRGIREGEYHPRRSPFPDVAQWALHQWRWRRALWALFWKRAMRSW
jgi:hypothetical protein